ncbi:MAG: thiamine pyrophosphate-dependent dehydrogenase E1 component subunit alpha [Thermodesulfobacteriota bacterium]
MRNKLKKKDYLEIYRLLFLTRFTEERMVEYHHHTPLPELPHVSIGQEAVAIGACYNLRDDDLVIPSLRTRGAFLAKGISSRKLMAGAFAKVTGAARGKNTSHHMGDRQAGIVAGTGVVGGHLPIGVGTALAAKLRKLDYVTVVFFGDGAADRGDFHESLNLAAVWKLPVIFVCENNLYSISTPASFHLPIQNIADRAAAYGMPGAVVDGNDVLAVYEASRKAYTRARKGDGPTLLECKTYRWRPHSERDPRDTRPKEEIEAWKLRCPIKRFREHILSRGIAPEDELDKIVEAVKEEVRDAFTFAQESPYPPAEEALLNVYASEKEFT